MNFVIICLYCDHKETRQYFSKSMVKGDKCSRCGDKNLKVKEESSTKIDTYIGCPEFPDTESKDDDKYDNYL